MQKNLSMVVAFLMCTGAQSQTFLKETVTVETAYGTMKIKLYRETPQHSENFLKLARAGFYDSLLFHRVINHFMIQGGDPLSRRAQPGDSLGHGDIGYMVPAEFNDSLFHRRGALAAAREGDAINPQQASSGSQFYIVMGKVRTAEDMDKYEKRITAWRSDRARKAGRRDSVLPFKFSPQRRAYYMNNPGTPHLDGSYTVFGQVVEGMEVIEKIAGVATDQRDRPVTDIRMKVSIVEK